MKRIWSVLLLVAMVTMCIAVLPTKAEAAEIIDSGTCGANLTWTLDDQGTLTISGTGNMTNYASQGAPWFSTQNRSRIKKVIIEEGVTSIGSYAFANLSAITEITTPSTITKIGERALLYCASLQSFVVPNGVRTIAEFTFSNCTSLTTVVIPDSVRSFDDMAFNNCSSLEYINIPDGVTELPYSMLAGCNSLEYISIPSTVTRIHPEVFDDCGNLWDVYFAGTSSQYQSIRIDSYGNEALSNAIIHYSSKAPCRTHAYGTYTQVSDTQHSRTCSNCGHVETVSHTWNSGIDTKPATCKDTGVKTFTCTGCNATKTEDVEITNNHSYSSWTDLGNGNHKHTCDVCSKEEIGSHNWNNGKVTTKATCKEAGEMIYTCTVCNATRTEAIPHLTTHTYDHDCDADCNICGQTRNTSHDFSSKWKKDKTHHWHVCSVCGAKSDNEAHVPGPEATDTTAQTCTVCGYEIAPALGVQETTPVVTEPIATEPVPTEPVPTEPVPTEPVPTEPVATEPTVTDPAATVPVVTHPAPTAPVAPTEPATPTVGDEGEGFPWWIILIAVVVICGATAVVLIKKKKS